MKIKLTIEVETLRDYDPGHLFYINQDFVRSGPMVVTAKGSQEYGIKSAVVVSIQKLEKDCHCVGLSHRDTCPHWEMPL